MTSKVRPAREVTARYSITKWPRVERIPELSDCRRELQVGVGDAPLDDAAREIRAQARPWLLSRPERSAGR